MSDPVQKREAFLPRLSVRRPVSVFMIFCALLLVGAIACVKLPITLMPSGFDPPFLWVWVSYRYANPAEIEELARLVSPDTRHAITRQFLFPVIPPVHDFV